MASLQEQLIKAGLVDKSKANKAKKERQKQANLARRSKQASPSEASVLARQEKEMRLARERDLNQKKQEASSRKAIIAQVRQLVEGNKLDRGQGEISYSYAYRGKIKKIIVTEELKNQLTRGNLAIVTAVTSSNRIFEIVPAAVAEKIAQRDAESVILLNEKTVSTDNDDDPYADYQVPDDLTW